MLNDKIQHIFFVVSMMFPHYNLMYMNTPKSGEGLPNLGKGTVRGAHECSTNSLTLQIQMIF